MSGSALQGGAGLAVAGICVACATAAAAPTDYVGDYDFEDASYRLEVKVIESRPNVFVVTVRDDAHAPWRELSAAGSIVRADAEPLRGVFDSDSPTDRSSCLVGTFGRYTIPFVCRVPPGEAFGFAQNAGTGIERISVRSGWVYPLATPAGLYPLELKRRLR